MLATQLKPLFTKCCYCIPLRTGCFILGYLNLTFNTIHTLALLTLTTYIGIHTHGFDLFDSDSRVVSNQTPEVESVQAPYLNEVGLLLMVILCANVAWLVINVACLVGLHKKRTGPIRVYVIFATARLLLSVAGLIYLVMTEALNIQAVLSNSIDIALTAYFVVIYAAYAIQLASKEGKRISNGLHVGDISFIYPPIAHKKMLVA